MTSVATEPIKGQYYLNSYEANQEDQLYVIHAPFFKASRDNTKAEKKLDLENTLGQGATKIGCSKSQTLAAWMASLKTSKAFLREMQKPFEAGMRGNSGKLMSENR